MGHVEEGRLVGTKLWCSVFTYVISIYIIPIIGKIVRNSEFYFSYHVHFIIHLNEEKNFRKYIQETSDLLHHTDAQETNSNIE